MCIHMIHIIHIILMMHMPPKKALIALFAPEVRLTCCKTLELSRRVQIICTISTSDTYSKTFSEYFFESIHHFDMVD